jgi:cobalt/nickel transport system ATP-binding protein
MGLNVEEVAIFRLEQIYFNYAHGVDRQEIFKNLCFALHDSDKFGLYGPNGSGKTTFFRLVTGLLKPQSGQVFFHGKAMCNERDFHSLRCKVGFVLQQAEDQLFCPTVLDDVSFGPLNIGLAPQEARATAVQTLHTLGLEGFEDRLVHKLSGGEKKLVALASVLAMQPEALLLDEPTSGLDEKSAVRISNVLKQLTTARIIISHDKNFLAETSTKILTITDGKISSM